MAVHGAISTVKLADHCLLLERSVRPHSVHLCEVSGLHTTIGDGTVSRFLPKPDIVLSENWFLTRLLEAEFLALKNRFSYYTLVSYHSKTGSHP